MERQNTEEVSMTMPSVSNNLDLVFDDEQRERTVNMHFTFTFRVPPPLSIPTYATPSEPRPLPKRKADNELTHASLKARFPNIVSEPMFFSPSSALTTIDEFKTRLQARSPPATSGYSVKIEDHCVPLFKSPGSETFVDFWYRYNEEVKNNRPKMLLSSSTPQKFHTSPVAKILLDASEGAPVPIDGKTFECSHLCDTSACVRVSHVRWEDKDVSYARRSCFTNLSKHLLPLLDGVDTGISIQRFCINSIHADEPCDFARYIANEQLVVDTWMVYHDVDDLISVSPDTIGHVNSVSSLASSFRFASLSLDGDFLVPAKLVSLSVAASGKAAFTIADFHPFQGEERAILELSSTAQSNGQSTRDLYAQQSAARAHIGEWAGVDRADSKTAQTFVRPSIRQSTAVDQPMRQPDIDSNRWAALAKTQIDMAYRAHGIIKPSIRFPSVSANTSPGTGASSVHTVRRRYGRRRHQGRKIRSTVATR